MTTTDSSGNDDPLDLIGVTIDGRYQVVRLVEEGGFSYVYQAKHALWKSPVAIKCLKHLLRDVDAEQPAVSSFIAEGALLAELSGRTANIVQARDIGTLPIPGGGAVLYMVLEWLEGATLDAVLRAERAAGGPAGWPIERVLRTLEPIAQALDMAHRRGVIHRDLKPSNIFLVQEAGSGSSLVKLLDFGIAKVMQEITRTSEARGPFTPAYGAPEQFSAQHGPTGPWTDIYALALVSVELLTGRRPTQGDNVIQLNVAACDAARRPTPRRCGLDLGDAIEAVFQKALAVAPHQRFQSAASFWDALTCAARAPGPPAAPMDRTAPRRPWVAAPLLFLLGFAGAWALSSLRRDGPLPGLAAEPAPKAQARSAADVASGPLASFAPLPPAATSPDNPLTEDKIKLGRMLFHEPRLSRDRDLSCASCHPLDAYGMDGRRFSIGHASQVSTRNTPSIYNVAGQFAFAWDGRAPLLEEQAKAPLLAPDLMAMDEPRVVAALRSITGYATAFALAFPEQPAPISLTNVARAIAAFERKLFTRGRWDAFLEGDRSALTAAELSGFDKFIEVGCVACHFGPYVGATMFQKAGLVIPWPNTRDRGRFEVTRQDVDWMVFKVPALRNVERTAPYFHDGSASSLDEAVRKMARHQLGKELADAEVASILVWLRCLTGEIPRAYVEPPALPAAEPQAPKPKPERR